MMIDGPLPKVGSIPVPRKPFSLKRFANAAIPPALCVSVLGILGMVSAIVDQPAPAPAPVAVVSTPQPVATPDLRLSAAIAKPIATPVAKKAPVVKKKKKATAKKSPAKKTTKKKAVARR